jgi:hypothetical protein
VLLPLHLVHRFVLSTLIRGSEIRELITLRSLDPCRLCGAFVVSWEPPIHCGVGPNLVVCGPVSALKEIP